MVVRVGLLLVVACGDGASPVALSDLANKLKAADCTHEVACEIYPDQTTCLAATAFQSDEFLTTVADAMAGRITYDAALGGACVRERGTTDCTDTFRPTTRFGSGDIAGGLYADADTNDPCNRMFSGTIETSDSCVEGTECVAGDVCDFPPVCTNSTNTCCTGASAGTCIAKGQTGASCRGDLECADTFYCNFTGGMGTCQAQLTAIGAPCNDVTGVHACAPPLHCKENTSGMLSSTCVTQAAHGATCDPTDFLQPCIDIRDYCDPTTTVCTRRIPIGGVCSPSAPCVPFATCDATTSICVALPRVDEACTIDANGFSNCLYDLQCMNGMTACAKGAIGCTCAVPPPGMACQ